MKAKVYLKMLACLVGLLTFYSCNNDLEQDKNASTVGINLGSITYNGITYGACIKAYLINQTFGLTRY